MVRATCTLQTLLIANNHLKSIDDVRHVIELPALSTLDVQDNEIEDPAVRPADQTAASTCVLVASLTMFTLWFVLQIVEDVLENMPALTVLYLKGNPVVKKIKHYRKTLIARLPKLK